MISRCTIAIPVFECPKLGSGSGITGHEYHSPNGNASLDQFLGNDDGANGIGFHVVVEIFKRSGIAQRNDLAREYNREYISVALCAIRNHTSQTLAAYTYIGILENLDIQHDIINPLQMPDSNKIINESLSQNQTLS